MTDSLPIRFFRYSTRRPIHSGDADWREPLPENRRSGASDASGAGVSLGEYFDAVADFLNGSGRAAFRSGIAAVSGVSADSPGIGDAIREVDVILEKHGAFYHPARIRIRLSDRFLSLALNVAVSDIGRRTVAGEFENLRRLGVRRDFSALPAVFGIGAGRGSAGEYPMFLGEWLEGFREFHLSRDEAGSLRIVVWGPDGENRFLERSRSDGIYREVARILARHCDPRTGEQIFPWHHAAGDFVVRADDGEVAVRLVTVRRYAPLFAVPDDPGGLEGLFLFLANLGLRTRVDRLDGVGEIALADVSVLSPTVAGMLAGLADRGGPADEFRAHLRAKSPTQLAEAATALVNAWHPDAPETPMIREGLVEHVLAFWEAANSP